MDDGNGRGVCIMGMGVGNGSRDVGLNRAYITEWFPGMRIEIVEPEMTAYHLPS
jgi:hypothetical protein